MNIGLEAAAEGRAEMAFWPAAIIAYVYADQGGLLTFLLVFVFSVTGGMNYLFLRKLRSAVKASKEVSQRRRGNSRRGVSNTNENKIESAVDAFSELLPERRLLATIAVLSLIMNIAAFVILFFYVIIQVWQQPEPNPAIIGLFLLPILYLAVVVCVMVWRV